MNDLEPRLRDAGARLRDTAPTVAATEAALAGLGDVTLDDLDTRRSRRWIIGPAVLAAAAAVIGVVVVTRPDEAAIVPADTTTVVTTVPPSPAPTTVAPAPTPAPTATPEASPPPSPPVPTTLPGIELGGGVVLTESEVDFDGAGGACLTLSTATDAAFGCVDGATMGSAYGQPLSLRLDGTPYAFFPRGVDGAGEPELSVGDTAVSACFAAVDLPGALVENPACAGDGVGVLGVLPAAPDGAVTWTVTGVEGDVPLELLTAAPDLGARVFRAVRPDASETCIVVVARNNSMREACSIPGTSTSAAGTPDAPLIVNADTAAGVATVEALDPGTVLRINDCGDLTAGELVALLPEHGMARALICGADVGAVHVMPTLVDPRFIETSWDLLGRGPDGTWTVSESGVDYTCTSGLAAEVCAELGVFDLAQSPGDPERGVGRRVRGSRWATGRRSPAAPRSRRSRRWRRRPTSPRSPSPSPRRCAPQRPTRTSATRCTAPRRPS